MSENYIKCIDRFCAGEVNLTSEQLIMMTPFCMKSSKIVDIRARNYQDEFIPLMLYSHFDTVNSIYRMKHSLEPETGYDVIDVTKRQAIQIKRIYDNTFWRSTTSIIEIEHIESYFKSITYGIVRKHLYTYTNTHIVAHIPIRLDSFNDIEVEKIINENTDILSLLYKNGNTITVTASKPNSGTSTKIYKKKISSKDMIIKLIDA